MRARIIAATNQDLHRAVEEGRSRADLYFRLNVFQLKLPTLRERPADIPLLARKGLSSLASSFGMRTPSVSDECYARMIRYPWPGNVRELMNVMERLLAHGGGRDLTERDLDGVLDETMFWPDSGDAGPPFSPALPVARPTPAPAALPQGADERDRIANELIATGGNVARAARRLDMARSTLRYKVRRYRLKALIPSD